MRIDQKRQFDLGKFIPDIETTIVSVLVLCVAVYGRYQRDSKPTISFGLLMIGWALFLMPKIYLLIEKRSKGWGLHDPNAGFVVLYRVGYALIALGTIGIIISLFT